MAIRRRRRTLVARAWPVDGPPRPVLDAPILAGSRPAAGLRADAHSLVGWPDDRGGRGQTLGAFLLDGRLRRPRDTSEAAHVRSGFAGLAAFHQVRRDLGPRAEPGNRGTARRGRGLAGPVVRPARDGFSRTSRRTPRSGLPGDGWSSPARSRRRSAHSSLRGRASRWTSALPSGCPTRPLSVPGRPPDRPGRLRRDGNRLGGRRPGQVDVRMAWRRPSRAAAAMDAYSKIRPLQAGELALIPVSRPPRRSLSGGRWASWHFFEGKVFDDSDAVIRGLHKGVDRLASLSVQGL